MGHGKEPENSHEKNVICNCDYLTNKFQPLDIAFNKPAKSFIKKKYNKWYTEQITKQLNQDKDPADVESSLNLSHVQPLHAKWHSEIYKYL